MTTPTKAEALAELRKVENFASYASDTLRSYISAQSETPPIQQGEWLPIESAPKDGTKVLGFAPNKLVIDPNFRVVTMWWRKWQDRGGDHWCWQSTESGSHIDEPTHWMPLPAPPTPKEG